MTTENQVANVVTPKLEVKTPVIGDFGCGRYTPLMDECFTDAQAIFKLSPEKADKLSRRIASDFGAAMAATPVTVKQIKAANKDGKITLAEAAKVKGITLTNPLFALMAMQYANECGKHGFNRGNTSWKVSKPLVEYFESL